MSQDIKLTPAQKKVLLRLTDHLQSTRDLGTTVKVTIGLVRKRVALESKNHVVGPYMIKISPLGKKMKRALEKKS